MACAVTSQVYVGVRVWSLNALSVPAWVLSTLSGFHTQSKSVKVRRTDASEMSIGVCICQPWDEMATCPGRQPFQCHPECRISGDRKQNDGLLYDFKQST